MNRSERSLGAVLVLGAGIAIAPVAALLGRSWQARVEVAGHSMEPTLLAGDWLLVDPSAYRARPPRAGDLAVAPDPRAPDRLLVKRVAGVDRQGDVSLAGDQAAHAADIIGPVAVERLVGRPWFRYWPPRRMGRLR